jgi:hypothetical protein
LQRPASAIQMKDLLFISCFLFVSCFFLCCAPKESLQVDQDSEPNPEWSSYEGRIPLDDHRALVIELNLLASAIPSEGEYKLIEYIDDGSSINALSKLSGTYSSYQGGEKVVVQLLNSSLGDVIKRTYYAKNEKGDVRYREENLRAVDMRLVREGDESFSVLATTLQPVSGNANDRIYKRTSMYFTIEGYFRHTGDSADFFEINTETRWAVTKMGAYNAAIRQYHELAQDKFQPVYLKGVGFSINRPDKQGNRVEALVIKKLVQMSSVSQTNE